MNSTYLKSLRIIYFSLAMGIVLFLAIAVFIHKLNGPFAKLEISEVERTPFLLTLIVLTLAIFVLYRNIFPKKLDAIKALPTLDRKLAAWRELSILRGALIEAPAFFAIVIFMLLGNYFVLIWPIAGIILFWISQPSRESLIRETNLSHREIEEFDKME